MNRNKIASPLLLLLAAMLWGFAFAAQDAASGVPAFALGMSRSVLGCIFLSFVIVVFDKIRGNGRHLISKRGVDFTRKELIGGVITGAILTVASAFQQLGINGGTDGGKAAFITAIYVVLVPIYSLAIKKRAGINIWISVVISIIGFYLLCISEDFNVMPSDMLVLASSLLFPLHILFIDYFSPKVDGIRLSCIQFFTAAILNALLALIFEGGLHLYLVASSILPVLYLGIVSSGIAYTLQILGQKGVNPSAASIILSLESVFGILGTALFLDKTLSAREYLGCFIVLVAVILSQLEKETVIKYIRKNKNEAKNIEEQNSTDNNLDI